MKPSPDTILEAFGVRKRLIDWVEDPLCATPASELVRRLRQGMSAESAISSAFQERARKRSGFTGVTWDARYNCWLAQIYVSYSTRFLGRFKGARGEIEAAVEYDLAARELHGKDAEVNFRVPA